jgi:hypothetical protein
MKAQRGGSRLNVIHSLLPLRHPLWINNVKLSIDVINTVSYFTLVSIFVGNYAPYSLHSRC